MLALFCLFLALFASPFKSKSRLEAENAVLRRQLIILRRKVRGRVHLTNGDRLFLVQLYRWFPSVLKTITIIQPETLVRWHRAGFRRYWRWKSRSLGGRPQLDADLRALIRRISVDNPLWGAPRIRGELLKLGFEVAQSSVARYMVKRPGPPSQGWRTFLHNHSPDIAAMDLFVVPTLGFDLLYAFIIVRLARRDLVWINVTSHPTADWIARQITEAFPWNKAPRYLIRARDQVYGRCHQAPIASHGHPRQTYHSRLALAERLRRKTDRIDPTRVRRPCDRLGRGASTWDSASLCPLLQRSENAPIVGQRCAILAPGSADWSHHVACAPWRTASPLHARLSFRYTHPRPSFTMLTSDPEMSRLPIRGQYHPAHPRGLVGRPESRHLRGQHGAAARPQEKRR
jgi:hypothetical protein